MLAKLAPDGLLPKSSCIICNILIESLRQKSKGYIDSQWHFLHQTINSAHCGDMCSDIIQPGILSKKLTPKQTSGFRREDVLIRR